MENTFDPNAAAVADSGIYGLPCSAEEAQIIIIPVEWELTTSYNRGTVDGPETVREASLQVDLCHHDYPDLWQKGIWMDEFPTELRELHDKMAPISDDIINALYEGTVDDDPKAYAMMYEMIEDATEKKNAWLRERIAYWRAQGKVVGLLGGDHSCPLAYHQYLNSIGMEYGILHADAHCDLREAFEGFKYSHASIFYNTLKFNNVKKLVQVGIRDYCHQEKALAESQPNRIKIFFDRDCRRRMYEGATWKSIVDEMVAALPNKVYLSIDIDALDPKLCPNTGTPVPGGLEYEELMYLLNRIREAGKDIIGFDLCEVSPSPESGEWDGNVGARVLFHLCGVASKP
ncbi:MAG: agmatinase family protein [Bacteroidales bacterium]|jgi:agmatinase|nr:agmatinase family protein [Bacteroidales bacterium]